MANKQYSVDAVKSIAQAIRNKNGSNSLYKIGEMASAINALGDMSPTKMYSFDQRRSEVASFLDSVTYSPNDYTVSSIAQYVGNVSSNIPSGISIDLKTAGVLTVIDGYTGRSATGEVTSGTNTIYNCTPSVNSVFILRDSTNQIVQTGLIHPTGDCRMIYLPNVGNVRDLGGLNCDGGKIRYGLLYRGAEPYNNMSDAIRNLSIDFLGIQKEINLQFASDLNGRTESGFGPRVDMLHVDMTWNDLSYQKTSGHIRAIFDPLMDYVIGGHPTYFHCAAGADRTGVVALLCEAILGVAQSDIDKDYELTCFYTGADTDANARRRNETVWTREINYINTFDGDTFRDRTVNLFLSCGVTIDKINKFRSAMINGTPEILSGNVQQYAVQHNLAGVSCDNSANTATQYQPYVANLMPGNNKVITGVKVIMGGNDITNQVFSGSRSVLNRQVLTNLTQCSTSNRRPYAIDGQSYVTTITPDGGHILDSVKITMAGTDITDKVFSGIVSLPKRKIKLNLESCSVDNDATYVFDGEPYTATLIADAGKVIDTVMITMGGVDVSNYYSSGVIAIPEVTGDIVITATAVKQALPYTNLLDSAIDMSGNVIGHTPMYSNMRWNSSSGDPVSISGYNITGLIPCKPGDTVRIRWGGKQDEIYQQIKGFTSDKAQVYTGYMNFQNLAKGASGSLTTNVITNNLANGKFDFTFREGGNVQLNGMAYMAIVLYGSLDNVIVTVNEEISE